MDDICDRFQSEPWAAPRHAEPFFTESEPCLDCGLPVEDCQCNIPDEPILPSSEWPHHGR